MAKKDVGIGGPGGITCGSCKWWEAPSYGERGICRRRAPQAISFAEYDYYTEHEDDPELGDKMQASWPHTDLEEWCGDWAGEDS
jgi:hypothetical protein